MEELVDWEKLEHHLKAISVSEKWLIEANFTKQELDYITETPTVLQRAKKAQKKLEASYKYLSANKSKQIEDF